ncbi:MAG: response regulator [Deltaproteobacteria bacterium]|nr:response regulator [Deltaproteobacteria bacterium]
MKKISQKPENRRILVVDDEPEIRQGYRRFLSPEKIERIESSRSAPAQAGDAVGAEGKDGDGPVSHFEVTEAISGDQALEIVQRELSVGRRFAGAIVDVRMPGRIDGLQFMQKAWEMDPNLLVVLATAYQDRSVDEIARFLGARFQDQWDYLNKPFTSGEIIQKARQLVSSWNRREREHAYVEQIKLQQNAMVAQEQLAAVGKLAHSIGHDLGNIMQQILTKLELENGPGSQPESRDERRIRLNEEMIEAVELGSTICQDLLAFARRSREVAPPNRIAIAAPLQKSLRLLRQLFRKKDITAELALDESAETVAHEARLVQVFVNLLTNAVQAMADGGKLKISLRKAAAGGVDFELSDNGPGIAVECLPQVFEPLFTTKGAGGNGLGLTVCKTIIESYGGTIAIESKVQAGTTVRIHFS